MHVHCSACPVWKGAELLQPSTSLAVARELSIIQQHKPQALSFKSLLMQNGSRASFLSPFSFDMQRNF